MRALFPMFRYLLAVLIIVLPLQGSTATLMCCGAGVPMAGSVHGMVEGHCGHAPAAAHKATSAHIKCNAGAHCGIGAMASPTAPARLSPDLPSTETQPAREPAMTFFVPPALERPPRRS